MLVDVVSGLVDWMQLPGAKHYYIWRNCFGMSMLKNLKSLFIVEEEAAARQPAKGPEKTTPKPAATAAPSAAGGMSGMGGASSPAAPGKVNAKFSEILLSAMEKANIDGFDYLEFKRSLQSLEKMPMDESTRFQSAFAMAQSMGATPQHLITTANHYLSVLAKEEKQFEEALANQQDKNIAAKQETARQLEQAIKAKEDQIKGLQQEIQTNLKQMEGIANEVAEARQKLETTKSDFLASYENLVMQIRRDVDSMEKYLK